MSASPQQADILVTVAEVCKGPKPEIALTSLNYLVLGAKPPTVSAFPAGGIAALTRGRPMRGSKLGVRN